MKRRIILHSDANNFFVSVECATRPELRDKCVAVSGNPEKRTGIILAKNENAKRFGVKTGDPIWQAKKKCPDLICLPPHYDKYAEVSKALHEIYLDYTDLVEPMGLDECWLDVTNSVTYLKKTGNEIADEIRERVRENLNITVSVGVSFSKIFAKLGSDMKKPDATTCIPFETFKKQTYHLPLNSIVGIGRRLERKFDNMNVTTIGDFVALPQDIVSSVFGKTGRELQDKLAGKLADPVACYYLLAPPKSIGNGTTTIIDIQSRPDCMKVIGFLCEKVSVRLVKGNFMGKTITVSIRTSDLDWLSHSKTTLPMQTYEDVFKNAMAVLDDNFNYDTKVRALRVKVSSLVSTASNVQLSFFDKKSPIESINKIKSMYGEDKIFIASDKLSFINDKSEIGSNKPDPE